MRVDARAVEAIDRKITRAADHLRWLYDDMKAWDSASPWKLQEHIEEGGRRYVYRVRLERPIPPDWAIVLGEVIHNLHSALEQSVYWLTIDWTRQELRGTAFPLYNTRIAFYLKTGSGAWNKRSGMYRIRGLGPGPMAFIEALQPYPQRMRHFYCQDLRAIHDLRNQDKHRLVHLWGLRFDYDVRFQPWDLPICQAHVDRRVLRERQIALKILCTHPIANLQVRLGAAASITIKSGQRRSGGGSMSLWHTASTAADVIRKLVCAIGRQDQPISLDAWTHKSSDLV